MIDSSAHREAQMFAAYIPRLPTDKRIVPNNLTIRPSLPADRDALGEISWIRNGGTLADHLARFERYLAAYAQREQSDQLCLTALVEDRPVGFGKVAWIARATDAPANHAPEGFYLGGVTIHPQFRRRGVGHELTDRRLRWIQQRADDAFYFVNAQNRASIDLHARFGFVELTRDFFIPGASFIGGVGILFRIDLKAHPV